MLDSLELDKFKFDAQHHGGDEQPGDDQWKTDAVDRHREKDQGNEWPQHGVKDVVNLRINTASGFLGKSQHRHQHEQQKRQGTANYRFLFHNRISSL